MDPVIKDAYKSIAARSEGLFKDNGSRFIAFAFPWKPPTRSNPS